MTPQPVLFGLAGIDCYGMTVSNPRHGLFLGVLSWAKRQMQYNHVCNQQKGNDKGHLR